jgi:hypothetical protein
LIAGQLNYNDPEAIATLTGEPHPTLDAALANTAGEGGSVD